jgi:hypothetical protein
MIYVEWCLCGRVMPSLALHHYFFISTHMPLSCMVPNKINEDDALLEGKRKI